MLVGEFEGDTGTTGLLRALAEGYELSEAVPLENWTDTSHCLTVWARRAGGMGAAGLARLAAAGALACRGCGAPDATVAGWCGLPGRRLRRCVFDRASCYCSQPCLDAGAAALADDLACRLVFLGPYGAAPPGAPDPFRLDGPCFRDLEVGGAGGA